MSRGNRLERNGQLIRKYFASHMDYSQESKVYEKLNGTGLSPEVTLQYDGFIEKKYVEGPTFAELFDEHMGEPQKLAELFETFCCWYGKFREATNLLLGNIEPSKFIMTDNGFVYLDFEHCRPGFMETDLAHMVKWMSVTGGNVSDDGALAAKLFVCVCSSKFKLSPDRLEKALKKEFETYGEDAANMIRFMTSAAVVVCRSSDEADVRTATAAFAYAPERYLCVLPGSAATCPGFELLTGTEGACMSLLARKTSQPTLMVLFTGPDCDTSVPLFVKTEKVRENLSVPMDVDVKTLLHNIK